MKLSIEKDPRFALGRPVGTLRLRRLAIAGLAVWAAASSFEPVAAAPPLGRHQVGHHQVGHHQVGHHQVGRHQVGYAPAGPVSAGGCTTCGKKRRNVFHRVLDGVTAGTDWLIFGTPYQASCECDSGCDSGPETACDAIGQTPYAPGLTPFGGGAPLAPTPVSPGIELLPAPIHHPPMPPSHLPDRSVDSVGSPAAAPGRTSPKQTSGRTPTNARAPRDQYVDPFSDDPVSQGSNPAISRSAYYED